MGSINIVKPLLTFLLAAPLVNPNNIDNFFLWNARSRTRDSLVRKQVCQPLSYAAPRIISPFSTLVSGNEEVDLTNSKLSILAQVTQGNRPVLNAKVQ